MARSYAGGMLVVNSVAAVAGHAQPTIAFQGERGSNSDAACRELFPQYTPRAYASFEMAFDAIASREAQFGLIPIENSLAGRVADVHHLLPGSGLRIVGERFRPIRFDLLANPGTRLEGVRTVSSHVMALAQCRQLLRRLGAASEASSDTAGAARLLALSPDATRAVLAPPLAAELYGLETLAQAVEDEAHNTTRFLLMAAEADEPHGDPDTPHVTSFVFRVRNIPAALFKVLSGFATNGVNMTKLESYMQGGSFTATQFYAEIEGDARRVEVARAFEELAYFSDRFEILGVFPADPFRYSALAG